MSDATTNMQDYSSFACFFIDGANIKTIISNSKLFAINFQVFLTNNIKIALKAAKKAIIARLFRSKDYPKSYPYSAFKLVKSRDYPFLPFLLTLLYKIQQYRLFL